jgi:membrane-bound lytic murein transglycosylase A
MFRPTIPIGVWWRRRLRAESVPMSTTARSRKGLRTPTRAWRTFAALALVASSASLTMSLDRDDAMANTPKAPAVPPKAQAMLPNQVAYQPVTFKDLPGWAEDDHARAFKAFLLSCERLRIQATAKPSTKRVPPPLDLLRACDVALLLQSPTAKPVTKAVAKAFFEREFTPHTVVHSGQAGLLTGYYEPVLDGARVADKTFSVPVHKRPQELVNLVDETERGAKSNNLTHARQTDKGPVPFATRAEIDQGALAGKGLELLYLADPVDKFFMQIQGSGRIRLPDGTMIRVAYAGKNGHPYTSVGRYLIDQSIIGADRMTLDALGQWLRADGKRGRDVMWQNKSYVFFRELVGEEAGGPVGALDIRLTDGRSLAVDAGFHALGLPIHVSSPTLSHATKSGGFHRLMIAQDVGSAIKGPERGDIYFGSGLAAGKLAGVTKQPGKFYVLLPKAAAPLNPAKPAR